MGDIVRRKIYLCLAAVMSIFVLTAVLLFIMNIRIDSQTPDLAKARIEVNQLVSTIEETGQYADTEYHYAIILIDGDVIYDNGIHFNERINIHQLGADGTKFYLTPFSTEDDSGFVYVELYPYFCGRDLTRSIISGIFSLITLTTAFFLWIITIRTLKRDIFEPVGELHDSTHQILCGKLDQPVIYDYDGQMGTLCHDFELMRTELLDGSKREQKLKEDEKLLMASISHDLKTPLMTVQGYLESICIGVVTTDDEIKEYCQSALNKTLLLSKMTNDILEHSKLELKQLSIEKEEVYSEPFFKAVLDTLTADARSRGMLLQCSTIPNVLLKIDRLRITQVMENIVGNSFKYCNNNGLIVVTFTEKASFLNVSIKDNGQGIEPEDLPFVFDRFFRGNRARKTGITGSGLGLSITKYIIEQHGGRIDCDSILGSWTEVVFCLPLS